MSDVWPSLQALQWVLKPSWAWKSQVIQSIMHLKGKPFYWVGYYYIPQVMHSCHMVITVPLEVLRYPQVLEYNLPMAYPHRSGLLSNRVTKQLLKNSWNSIIFYWAMQNCLPWEMRTNHLTHTISTRNYSPIRQHATWPERWSKQLLRNIRDIIQPSKNHGRPWLLWWRRTMGQLTGNLILLHTQRCLHCQGLRIKFCGRSKIVSAYKHCLRRMKNASSKCSYIIADQESASWSQVFFSKATKEPIGLISPVCLLYNHRWLYLILL